MRETDTHLDRGVLRSVVIDHACGHRYTHLVPLMVSESEDLIALVDMVASKPCPSCLLAEQGLPPILPERRAGIHAV